MMGTMRREACVLFGVSVGVQFAISGAVETAATINSEEGSSVYACVCGAVAMQFLR